MRNTLNVSVVVWKRYKHSVTYVIMFLKDWSKMNFAQVGTLKEVQLISKPQHSGT